MPDFRNKIVLITGAGKGAGRILAEAFAEHGATVAVNDVSPVNVEEVVARINQHGGKSRAYVDDVAKKVAVQALVKQVEDDFGRIDILVNHAAVMPHTSLLDMDEWDWHRVMDVNLTGAFLLMQSVGRMMRARGEGIVINLITGAGAEAGEDAGAYQASMGGLLTLTRSAAREFSPYGVRVNGVLDISHDKVVDVVFDLCSSKAIGRIIGSEAE
jgi:NAD(P)-dependent dehydrogenase (short-subunit alcohol dehydrogenase family)